MNPANKINTDPNPNQKAPKPKATTASKNSKNEEAQMIEELSSSKIGEKEFYEKIKPWIEGSTENFGRIILECMKLISQKNFLAYQLFKMLMGSKVKAKLKSMTGDTEKTFYASFWGIIEQQKGNVKTEGLKLLGFLTSEHLQNMSQQSQIDCLTQLKKLCNIKIYATNVNIIRLSYNCIGNILTNSNYKFIDENHEIFYNVNELLRDFNSIQKLEDPNNIKALAAALRVLGCLYLDLKVFPANVNEFLIAQLLKYLYFGTSFFPVPNMTFTSQSGTSSDSQMATSSSEISDMDDSVERKKEDEATAKIRNYSAVCLANIFRQNTKMIPQYFSTLLPCKILRKEVLKFIDSRKEPLILSDMEFPEKRNKRATHLLEFRNDFNEPTLLNLLLFEENSKVKLSVCKTISAILDGYYGDKLLLTIDGEKLEKTKIDPYKSISHQIYQIFKNVTLAVTVSILVETDDTLINHLLRLASTMLGHSSYEKVGHLTMQVFVENILSKMLPQYMNHTIYLSCISCFSSLASGNIRYKTFDRLAFRQDFNIVDILVHAIKDSLSAVMVNKDIKPTKPEKVSESTILLESIIALSKFSKHYFDQIIDNAELVVSFLEKTQALDKKYLNVTFKLFEETLKHLNNDKDDDQDGDVEVVKKEETPLNLSETIQSQKQVQQFHKLLAEFLYKIFNSNSENTEHILDILYYLQDRDWESYYKEVREKFIETFPTLNAQTNLKQSFLRLLGKLCTFSSFMKIEKFPRLVYEVVCQNANEKNNNVVIKSSWVLANLSANLPNFEMFSVEENQELFLLSLGYCNSPKEKLISNGFRALGYYISNNSDEILCKTILTENVKAENIKKTLGEVYKKPFSKYSVKVCWNVCVSLSNIFKSFKPNFMQLIFSEDILYNIAEILTTKNNFKTQIHCIETLTLAYSKFPKSPCFAALMKTLIKIYFAPDEVDFDVSELRYLPHLRSDISGMLLKLLKDLDYEKNAKFIIDVLVAIPHGLSKILYDALEKSYKEHKDKLVEEKWKGDEENKSPTITQKDTLMNFDEVMVKGMTPHSKLTILTEKLHDEELKSFKECLEELRDISKKIVGLIDEADELSVPFSVYNSLKQLTDLDLESKEAHISIDLDHI